jgi:phospholipid/cholesterol/gamma-HCH transport system permease protein
MQDSRPRIASEDTSAGHALALHGEWTAARFADRTTWRELAASLKRAPAGTDARWDLSGIGQLDHVGAQVLWNAWDRAWPAQVEVADAHRTMIDTVASLTTEIPPERGFGLARLVDLLGRQVLAGVGHLRHIVQLIGQLLIDLLRLVRAPHTGPWRDISGHLYSMGAAALPITALVGFLIGVVLAYLMSMQLRQFGAESFIVNILGISLIRELGPLLAAILVAGRSGSAITAQIGVMRVTEELDAMRVMGIAHGYRLVLPRAIALAIAMPLVAVWTTLASLAGGMLAADVAMNLTPAYFLNALPAAVRPGNLVLGVSKSVVFGLMIALVGCHYGLRVKPNTESLGQGTTASVVTSITVVILIDALFAILFKSVGI